MNMNVRRRDFLAGGAASAAALALPAPASAGVVDTGVLAGTLDRVLSPHEAEVTIYRDGAKHRVTLTPAADIVHGRVGMVTDLREFVPGEPVTLRPQHVEPGSNDIVVSEFKSLVECVAATISRRDDRQLETSSGTFVVSPILTRASGGADAGAARITYWTDPRTGARHANIVTAA